METHISQSSDPKQVSAYLKKRSARLQKKAKFARSPSVKEALLQTAERAMCRANEIYFCAG